MPAPVYVDFVARGMADVQRAFRSVATTAAQSETSATTSTRRSTNDRERAYRRLATEAAKWERERLRETVRAEAEQTRAATREAANRTREVEREARDKIRAMQRTDAAVRRIREQASREAARADAQASRAVARVGARSARDNEIQGRRRGEAYASVFGGAASAGARAALNTGVTGIQKVAGAIGGNFSIADSVHRTTALRGKLADIASRDTGTDERNLTKRRSTASLESAVRGVGVEFGIDANEGAEGLDKFASKTGNLKVGLDMLRGLAEMSRAGAGSMDDLADAAGDVFNADKTQNADQVLQKMRAFTIQGQKGAVEMKDLASQMAKIGAASGRFKDGGTSSILTMGALAQLARESGGASSASQATTAVGSLSNQFYKNARLDKMKVLGVDPKGEDGFNKPVEEILFDLMRGAEKKSRKGGKGLHDFDMFMGTAIADAQARKATSPLEAAFKKAGGGDAGVAAAKAELAKFGAGGRDIKGEMAGKAQARMQEVDAQMAVTSQKFEQAVSDKIIPKLLEMMPVIERMIPQFIEMSALAIPAFIELAKTVSGFVQENKNTINFLAAHPIGAAISYEVTKSIATAGIGEVIKTLFMKMFASSAATSVLPGGASTGAVGSSVLGPLALGLTAQVLAGKDLYDRTTGAMEFGSAKGAGLAELSRNGTAEQQTMAADEMAKARSESGGTNQVAAWTDRISKGAALLNPATIISAYASDKITEGLGYKSESQRAEQTIAAGSQVESFDKVMRAGDSLEKTSRSLNDAASALKTAAEAQKNAASNTARTTNMVARKPGE